MFAQQSDVEIRSRPNTVGFFVRATGSGWDVTFPITSGNSRATEFAGSDSTKTAPAVSTVHTYYSRPTVITVKRKGTYLMPDTSV